MIARCAGFAIYSASSAVTIKTSKKPIEFQPKGVFILTAVGISDLFQSPPTKRGDQLQQGYFNPENMILIRHDPYEVTYQIHQTCAGTLLAQFLVSLEAIILGILTISSPRRLS
jgi:hypothetical protein